MVKRCGGMGLGVVFILVAMLVMSWFPTAVCAEELKMEKAVVCTDVKDKLPVGEAKEFSSTTKKLFCYTIIDGVKEPAQITHVWSYQGKKVRETILPVKSPKWRTWSFKNILPGQSGAWTVDIIDTARQKSLGTVQFRIQ